MKKKETHFEVNDPNEIIDAFEDVGVPSPVPACGIGASASGGWDRKMVRTKRLVTCDNCKRTRAYREG